jgi:hypothetical protein
MTARMDVIDAPYKNLHRGYQTEEAGWNKIVNGKFDFFVILPYLYLI